MPLEHSSRVEIDLQGRTLSVTMRLALERDDDGGTSFQIACPLPVPPDHEDFFSQQIFNAQHAADTPSFPPAFKLRELHINPEIDVNDDEPYVLAVARVVAEMITGSCLALRGLSRVGAEQAPLDEREDRFVISAEPEVFRLCRGRGSDDLALYVGEDFSPDTLSIGMDEFRITMNDGTALVCDTGDRASLGPLEAFLYGGRTVTRLEIFKRGDLRITGDGFIIESLPSGGDGVWSMFGTGVFEQRSFTTYSRSFDVDGVQVQETGLHVRERSTSHYTGWHSVWPRASARADS